MKKQIINENTDEENRTTIDDSWAPPEALAVDEVMTEIDEKIKALEDNTTDDNK